MPYTTKKAAREREEKDRRQQAVTDDKTKTTNVKNARILSAIEKGKQTLLPCETKGLNLSKFEHNGRDGRLAVYAEEMYYMYNKFGHYKVIASFQPAESVQNQLFFGKISHGREARIRQDSSVTKRFSRRKDSAGLTQEPTQKERAKTRRQTIPDSFEELILRYRAHRERHNAGQEHLEVLEMLDRMHKRRKEEWSRFERKFSNIEKVRRLELEQETELKLREKQWRQPESEACGYLKLPEINISSVRDKEKTKLSKQDSKHLKVARQRAKPFPSWAAEIT